MKYFSRSLPRKKWIYLLGPLLVVGVAVLLEFTHLTPVYIPNPASLLVLAVVVTCFYGGTGPGLIAAVASLFYMAFFFYSDPLEPGWDPTDFRRLLLWGVTLPGAALVVGRLKQRSERLLRREIEERRTHEQAGLRNFTKAEKALFSTVVLK